jgi:hypothetical protein
MKCLSRTEIQEFIDKELEPSFMAEISDHIEKCENCSSLYRQAVDDKTMINRLLGNNESMDKNLSIPEFIPPVLYKKKKNIFRLIPYVVAASVIGFIFLFRPARVPVSEKIPEAEMLMYEFYDGKDLNRMWHEKSQIIILQDEKGNVIQSIITN